MKKKADKKVKKKEKKGKNENNKDSDFIPTWEDIQYVMNLANDSLKWLFTNMLKYKINCIRPFRIEASSTEFAHPRWTRS